MSWEQMLLLNILRNCNFFHLHVCDFGITAPGVMLVCFVCSCNEILLLTHHL